MARTITPMTAARGMGSLPQIVEDREGSRVLKQLFDRVDLPLAVISEPDHRLPLRDLIALFENAARVTGDGLFGLRVGTAMADKFGIWSRYARSAPDMRTCLLRAARGITFHQSGTELELSARGAEAKFTYSMNLRHPRERCQHLEHTIPALLYTFRTYAGASWRPRRIEVNYPADRRLKDVEEFLGVPLLPGADSFAVVFDADDLDLTLPLGELTEPPVTWLELSTMVRRRPPRSLAEAVAEVVQTRLLDGQTDIDGVAKRLGSGQRTLQRQLAQEGISYRRILGDARLARARHLLAETTLPIIEIAYALGYSDPAHFSRAFSRATAQAPSALRAARTAQCS